eukprot:gnl/MRDRNA2_/MRDRNA2_114459_c0_seq1.p1 gnl/MRDRNA2_/MRDRNA2_114459_c0~~gnl/MRDRNA2_/MRDRNA2_114459_c0_seq1.p1  ORF type:complete len:129 (+),score=39.21 gnl/MRDRNA2_/MRDRNA2_114459_c0_seq1:154-540(+)
MSVRFTMLAVSLCSALSQDDVTDAEMLDHVWDKFIPNGQQYMTKDNFFELVAVTQRGPELTESHWEAMCRSVEADPRQGLTKNQLRLVYSALQQHDGEDEEYEEEEMWEEDDLVDMEEEEGEEDDEEF